MIHFCFSSFYSCNQTSLTIFAYQVLDNVTLTCPYFIILLFILSNSVYCKLQILFSFFLFNSYSFFYCIILLLHHKADKCMFLFFFFSLFYFTRHIHQVFFPLLHLHMLSTNYLKNFIPHFAFFRTFS